MLLSHTTQNSNSYKIVIKRLTYLFLLLEGRFSLLSAGFVLGHGLFALVLELSHCVSSVTHIFNAQVQGLAHPAMQSTEDH